MAWIPRMVVPALVVLSLTLTVHAVLHASSSGEPSAPVGLTSQGRLLWNFEGLLRKTFGHRQTLCVSGNASTSWNFTDGGCNPLSKYRLYWYTFKSPHGTTFHLVRRRMRPPIFGNYPVAVLVRGHMIACGAKGRGFLVDYGSGMGMMLGCLTP